MILTALQRGEAVQRVLAGSVAGLDHGAGRTWLGPEDICENDVTGKVGTARGGQTHNVGFKFIKRRMECLQGVWKLGLDRNLLLSRVSLGILTGGTQRLSGLYKLEGC